MAINRVMKAALKALSYPSDIDLKKSYKLERTFAKIKHPPVLKPFYKIWDHKVEWNGHEIPVRIFYPEKEEKANSVLLFFHGGGWVTGDIDSYTNVCVNMSRLTKHIVVSVDYRLAPEHPFPAAPEDCYAVAREIFLDKELFQIDLKDITLIGDSAGGNLAAVVSLMARDKGEFLPSKQILIYPATYHDHSENSPFASVAENGTDYLLTSKRICEYMDFYAGEEKNKKNAYFAPLLASDFSNQPKTLIITAEFDPLRDEGEAYGKKLREAGNEVKIVRIPDALHGFFSLPSKFSQVQDCYKVINEFLKRS